MERWATAIRKIGKTNTTLFQNCGVGCSPSSGDGVGAQPWGSFCPATANMWRTGGDASAEFGAIMAYVANLAGRGHLAGPGGWNYPDSLEVGNGHRGQKLSPSETRAHFSMWCITSSPLILGNDVRNMSADDLAVVSNAAAIGVNQAWAGFAGDMLNYSQYPPANSSRHNATNVPAQSVWWKPLPNKSAAVVLLHAKGGAAEIGFSFAELQYGGLPALGSTTNCNVHSIWENKSLGSFTTSFSATVEGSACLFAIISGCA